MNSESEIGFLFGLVPKFMFTYGLYRNLELQKDKKNELPLCFHT